MSTGATTTALAHDCADPGLVGYTNCAELDSTVPFRFAATSSTRHTTSTPIWSFASNWLSGTFTTRPQSNTTVSSVPSTSTESEPAHSMKGM